MMAFVQTMPVRENFLFLGRRHVRANVRNFESLLYAPGERMLSFVRSIFPLSREIRGPSLCILEAQFEDASHEPQRAHKGYSPRGTPLHADLSADAEAIIAHCKWLTTQTCGSRSSARQRSNRLGERAHRPPDACSPPTSIPRADARHGLRAPPTLCGFTELRSKRLRGVLMLPPFYYKDVSEEGLYRNFAEVIERVGDARLRIYLYHIPPVAVVGITPKLVERLMKAYPSAIAGMKDSSGDWTNTKLFLDAFAKSGFDVFVGSETFLLANMRANGAGCISATANVNPAPIDKLYREWQNADAPAQQERSRVRKATGQYVMIPALQPWSRTPQGSLWATVRPTLVAITQEQAAKVSRTTEARLRDAGPRSETAAV